jgi:hypothetical protein
MKKIILIIAVVILTISSCQKTEVIYNEMPQKIDLGTKSVSTSIKSITQKNNNVIAEFETTVGAKYAVQIVPFGSEEPIKKDSFTATETLTTKTYDLSDLVKSDYDLIFIDVNGKEVKFPLVVK